MMETLWLADLLSVQPTFLIAGRTRWKTYLGAFFTIACFWGTIFSSFFFGKEWFQKLNPSVNTSIEENNNPPSLHLNSTNFEFFFSIENSQNTFYINEQVYYPILTLVTFDIDDNGNSVWGEHRFNLISCDKKANHELYHSYVPQKDLSQIYCISDNQSFKEDFVSLREYWGHSGFKMIQLKMYECKDTTSGCWDQSARNSIFLNSMVNVYIIDNIVHTRDYKTPFYKIWNGQFYNAPWGEKTSITQYFRHTWINDDDSWWFTSSNIKTSYILDTVIIQKQTGIPPLHFFSYTMQWTNKQTVYYRQYYKLQDFASQIGGLYKSFLMICSIMLFLHNYNDYFEYLINNFYHIRPSGVQIQHWELSNKIVSNNKADDSKEQSVRKELNDFSSNNNKLDNTGQSQKNLDLIMKKNTQGSVGMINKNASPDLIKNKSLSWKLKESLNQKRYFHLTFIDKICCLVFFTKKSKAHKNELAAMFFKGTQFIKDRIDMLSIWKSLYQLEILQYLIWNKYQTYAIRKLCQPVLSNFSLGWTPIWEDDNTNEDDLIESCNVPSRVDKDTFKKVDETLINLSSCDDEKSKKLINILKIQVN